MAPADTAQARTRRQGRDQLPVLRRIALGTSIALLAEYALGVIVNLYVSVPGRDHGGGMITAIGRALSNGPVALGVHAGVGLLLIAGAIQLLIRAVLAGRRTVTVLAAVNLLAIAGAAASGAAFVDSARDSASLAMGLLTGLALLCSVVSLYVLPAAAPPAR